MTTEKAELSVKADVLENFVNEILDKAVHGATSRSLASFSVGLLSSKSMTLHRIGAAMADVYGLEKKHTTKQVDRFLTKSTMDIHAAQRALSKHLLKDKTEALIAIDWTEFDADDQSTLCAYLLTTHGRALPLIWETHKKSTIKGQRTDIEIAFVTRMNSIIHESIQVVIMGDRGFGYQEFIQHLHTLGLDFVLRVRHNLWVEDTNGIRQTAREWLRPSGHARMVKDVRIAEGKTEVGAFVAVKAKAMKDGWFLVTSLRETSASAVVKLYGKRFSVEETFRDTKNDRFGLGLRATKIRSSLRRHRLLLICALAYILIVTLGQAGEQANVDSFLKVNTSKKRQLSLFNQGLEWLQLLQRLRSSIKVPLLNAFYKLLNDNDFSVLTMNDIASMEK